jgi:hypothetical protein
MAMRVNIEVLKYHVDIGAEEGRTTASSPKHSDNRWVHCAPWSL